MQFYKFIIIYFYLFIKFQKLLKLICVKWKYEIHNFNEITSSLKMVCLNHLHWVHPKSFIQLVKLSHIIMIEFKSIEIRILVDSSFICGFWNDDNSMLECPSEHDLGPSDLVFLSDCNQHGMVLLLRCCQWGETCQDNILFLTEL